LLAFDHIPSERGPGHARLGGLQHCLDSRAEWYIIL
jgi:hypothetical protein